MIIFLDIDGVLCTLRQSYASGELGAFAGLDPVALTFLNRICKTYHCKVVISSTWRYDSTRDHFYRLFACGGYIDLACALADNWRTESIAQSSRGHEIENWLLTNDPDAEYLIIDDISAFLPYQQSRVFLINQQEGMLMNDYIAIEQFIQSKTGIQNDHL